jgi:hypothetical protein
MWSFMSAVFSLAVDAGELAVNPCACGGRLYDGTRIEIWSPEQIDAIWIGGACSSPAGWWPPS